MQRPIDRLLRRAAALALAALVAAPDVAFASEPRTKPVASGKSLDAMSPAELDHFVQGLNESSNWRKYRRPGDPPDFVPGKPVRVMHGAGASFGRSGGGNFRSFRQSGLGSRRGSGSRRRGSGNGSDQSAMERGRGSSRTSSGLGSSRSGSSFGSSRSGSSFGSSRSGSSFGSGNSLGNGGGFNQ